MAALMGLSSSFTLALPPGLDVADNCLRPVRDIEVLHDDCLLAAVAMFPQGLYLGGKSAGQFVVSPFVCLELR